MDNKIIVRVPSADSLDKNTAGTGQIIVRTASSQVATSPQVLEIPYSVLNGGFTVGSNFNKKPFRLGDFNGYGGITLSFNQDFDTLSRQIFRAALDEWRCNTGVNFTLSPIDTPVDTAISGDGVSVIAYADLPFGVFAATPQNTLNCTISGIPTFYIDEFDLLLASNPTTPWFKSLGTGIAAGEKDIYSTMVHELGHGHLLNHAWTTVKVMYPYGTAGVLKRTLTNAEIAGGKKVMSYSNTAISCLSFGNTINIDSMDKYLCITPIESPIATKALQFYPNPAYSHIKITGIDDIVLSIQLLDYTGGGSSKYKPK